MAKPKLGKHLWGKFRQESILAQHTPFVVALASGYLEPKSFRFFVSQELHVLRCYIHVFELAAKAAEKDTKALFSLLIENLMIQDSLFKKWGYDWTKVYPATVKYTDFLLAAASGNADKKKVAAYTLGAMMPHIQLYAFIGKELQLILDNSKSSHPYEKWINYHSSKYFQVSTLVAEDLPTFVAENLLDKLSVSLTGQEFGIVQQLYYQAMKHELYFFSSLPMVQKTVVPLLNEHNPSKHHFMIFSDFDSTCTVGNSSAILENIAILRAPIHHQMQSQRMTKAELRNSWSLLIKEYTEEKEKLLKKILSAEYDRWMDDLSLTDEAEIFNCTLLKEALQQLSEFEKCSNTRIIESGVLRGLHLEDIKREGQTSILQDGCITFFQSITKNENISASIHVISQCWCSNLIKSAFSSGGLHTLDIHSNELTYEQSISTGEVLRKVESPIDKVELFRDILQEKGSDKNELVLFGNIIRNKGSDNDRKNLTIYVGDSVDDLLCLLEADIGIVIDTSESLKKVASRFGVSLVRLFNAMVQKQKEMVEGRSCSWTGQSATLYTVSSWAEIHSFILGFY